MTTTEQLTTQALLNRFEWAARRANRLSMEVSKATHYEGGRIPQDQWDQLKADKADADRALGEARVEISRRLNDAQERCLQLQAQVARGSTLEERDHLQALVRQFGWSWLEAGTLRRPWRKPSRPLAATIIEGAHDDV